MQLPSAPVSGVKRSVWLGVIVGWLAQMALSVVLPMLALVTLNLLAVSTGGIVAYEPGLPLAGGPGWMVQEAAIFIASCLAGSLAALLAPTRSIAAPVVLVLLSLLGTFFAQIPSPYSPLIGAIWAGGPCAGLLMGIMVTRRLRT